MKDGVLKIKNHPGWFSLFLLIFASALCCAQNATSLSNPPELVVQTGHSGNVSSLAFSPDGKTLASSSGDGTIKFWNFATGEQLRTIEGAGGLSGSSLAFGPEGKTIVSGDITSLAVWGVSSGAKVRDLNGSVTAFALSPNGRIIVDDNILKDASTGARLRMLDPTAHFESVAFSADGKLLASGSWEGTVKLWDVSTWTELRSVETGTHVSCVAFSPNGKLLAGAGMRSPIKLWDVSTGAELRSIESGSGWVTAVNSVAFSPDGKILASGGRQNSVKLWDVSTGAGLAVLNGYFSPVAFSPDGRTLATGSSDSTIKLWDLTTRSDVGVLKGHSEFVRSAAFSNDGKTLAAGSGDGTVRMWDVSTGGLRTVKGHSGVVSSVAFSPDGMVLASGGGVDGTVKLWQVSTGRELRSLDPAHDRPDGIELVVFSPDGRILASGGKYSSTLKLWDVEKGAELETLRGFGSSIAFSPDSQTLAYGDGGTVRLRNISTGADLLPLKIHPEGGLVEDLAFSPDGKTLATASIGRGDVKSTVKLWDFSSGRELRTLKGLGSPIAFSSDGKMLAGGSWNGILALSDVQSGIELRTFTGGHASVNSIAFSPNNKYLVSGNSDSTLKIWDVSSGKDLATLIALDQNDWLVVTPDGLFDGTPAAWNRILWRFNNNSFDHAPVEAFFNDFYYPGLLTDIFAGKHLRAPSELSQKDRRQPQLRLAVADSKANTSFTARKVAVRIDVAELAADKDNKTGSGAQDVRLFRNGSLVKLWQGDIFAHSDDDGCKLQVQTSPHSPRRSICTVAVPIIAGENHFTAYAFNNDNVKSLDAEKSVNGDENLKRPATLYILAIGVGQNSNAAFKLNYAAPDAQDFSGQIKTQQQNIKRYASTEVTTLPDEQATKENILAELKRLAALVHPEDGLIIYFSGHGTAQEKHFYMLPYDIGYQGPRTKEEISKGNNLAEILNHSISDQDLERVLRTADAGQIVLVIDACNSGQALNADDPRRGPMNSSGLAQLAYEKGMYILTASQDWEVAYESSALGHSYLTYALVEEGLKTLVADKNGDKQIDLREWFDFATQRVPRMRQERIARSAKEAGKQLEEVEVKEGGKVQQPRVFYRREPERQPLIVARP